MAREETAIKCIRSIKGYGYDINDRPPMIVSEAFDIAVDAIRCQLHGCWKETDSSSDSRYMCSLCGAPENDIQAHGKYCYNCGARMDGES